MKSNGQKGCFLIVLILLAIGFIVALFPLAMFAAGIYSIYYAKKNKTKLQEKFHLSKDKWYGNPIIYAFLIFCISTSIAFKSAESLYGTEKNTTKIEQSISDDNTSKSDNKNVSQIDKKDTKNNEKDHKKQNINKNDFIEAQVTDIIDGDTIKVSYNDREYELKMIGVNSPETDHPDKPVEYFGREAHDFTKSSLSSKTVYLQKDVSETDKNGRLLRYVWLSRPETNDPTEKEIIDKMFNAKLVKEGYAQAYTYQPDSKYTNLFTKLQNEAKNNLAGLWGKPTDTENINDNTSKSNINENYENNSDHAFNKDYAADTTQGVIKGNRKSMIYHVPGGRSYNRISEKNVVYFNSEQEAINAGYRKAKN